MNKLILSLAAVVLSVSVANAKTKSSDTYVAKNNSPERSYASENSFLAGGSNENEFDTMFTNGLFAAEKVCKNCDTGTTFDIAASYLHYLKEGFQVGGEGRLRLLSKEVSGSGDSETLIDLVAVGAYNFQSDLKNAIFLKLGIGLYAVPKDNGPADGYENKLGFFVGAGKRFALWNNVSYAPELRLIKKGDIDMGVEVNLLNFSVIW